MADAPTPRTDPGDPVSVVVVCREFVELVTEYLEGALSEDMERAIRAHLELCEPCVEYLDQMRRTASLLGTLSPPTLPPAVREQLLDVYGQLHGPPAGHP